MVTIDVAENETRPDSPEATPRKRRRDTVRAGGGFARRYARMFAAAFRDFLDDGALGLGAALAYYAVLSLAPLVLLVVGVAGLVGGREAISDEIVNQMGSLVGEAGAEVARSILQTSTPSQSVIAIIVGMVTLLVGATGVFVQLKEALNTIWEVQSPRGGGVWAAIKARLLSAAVVGALGFLLVVSLIASAGLELVQSRLFGESTPAGWLFRALHILSSLLVMSALFAVIFKVLPDVVVAWRDTVFGALITGMLVTLGKFGIGLYLGHSAVGSAYGAAGSLIVVLIWIYYSSLIVLLGAELTQVYAARRGAKIVPRRGASRVR